MSYGEEMKQTRALGACFALALALTGCSSSDAGPVGDVDRVQERCQGRAEEPGDSRAQTDEHHHQEETVIDGKLTAKDISGIAQELKPLHTMSGETVASIQVVPIG